MTDRSVDRGSRPLAALLYGGTLAAAAAAPGLIDRVARRLPRPAAELLVTAGLVGSGFVAVAAAERARPHRAAWNRRAGGEAADLFDTVVAASVALTVGSSVAEPLRRRMEARVPGGVLGGLPMPARVAASVVIGDLFHTSFHRMVHRSEVMWRFHAVHHSVPRLYGFNAGRFHPVEATLVMIGDNVVLALLGLDRRAAVSHRVLRSVFGQVQHSNVAMDSGALNAVLATPERHRWHHSPWPAERDTNFGSVVCLWDRALGTGELPAGRTVEAIGLGPGVAYPQEVLGQLLAPFRHEQPPRLPSGAADTGR